MDLNIIKVCGEDNKTGNIYLNHCYYTTNVREAYKHCVNQILLLKNTKMFYIGSTHNFEERMKEHMRNEKLYNMYILTYATTKLKSKMLKKKLLKRFGPLKYNMNNVKFDENLNVIINDDTEDLLYDKNFIYILFR